MNHDHHPPIVPHISLCSGYEGIGLGISRVLPNLRTIAYCEREAFAVANLVSKMENGSLDVAPVWTDVATFPWRQFRRVMGGGVLSFGWPCQPVSLAGQRKGAEDERWLFDIIANGIVELQPGLLFAENVEGLLSAKFPDGSSIFAHCITRLEGLGYTVEAGLFSAREAGAPHGRKRVFIMAHRADSGIPDWLANADRAGGASGGHDGGMGWIGQPNAWPAGPGEFQHDWEPPRTVRVANAERAERWPGDPTGGDSGEGEDLGRSETTGGAGECREPVADANSDESERGGESGVMGVAAVRADGEAPERERHGYAPGGGGEALADATSIGERPGDGSESDGGGSELMDCPRPWRDPDNGSETGTLADRDSQREPQPEGPERNLGGRPEYGGEDVSDAQGVGRGEGWPEPTGQQGRSDAAERGAELEDAERPILPGRITTSREAQVRGPHDQSGGSGACGERASFAPLGRDFDGRADWLDNAKLLRTACDSRIDELRLLGNGVVPATAAIAFMTLARKLCSNT